MSRPGLIRGAIVDFVAVVIFFAAMAMAFIVLGAAGPDYDVLNAPDPLALTQ